MPTDFPILVIGAGQSGLSAGYHLQRLGPRPVRDFRLDHAPGPGGARQFRWPSLTLTTVNRVHDLPGMSLAETLPPDSDAVPAATAVPRYYELYEKRFDLRVRRPVSVTVVCDRNTDGTSCAAGPDRTAGRGTTRSAETDTAGTIRVCGLINGTVTTTTWATRREPVFRDAPFAEEDGRASVAVDPRIHLIGYRPSASTIGANRAGQAAARELTAYLGLG